HLPYLLSPRGLARYQIVALCNSSTAAARAAISAFNLPSETRAYGSPADLAADADVELVICCTRVDVHHETVRPSLAAGKMVYCEWPLAQDLEHVRDLAQLAREKQVRTMVAVQGRVAPSVKKLRELLEHGRIGKVVSAEVRAAGGLNDREILPKNLEYFTKREVGGNVFTIGFGHLPNSKIRDPETNIVKTVQSDVPDLIIVTSSLEESAIAQKEATLLVRFRRGQPSFDEPALVWNIIGEKGEIRLTNSTGTGMHATGDTASVRARGAGFRDEQVGGVAGGLALDALKRHEQLDGMLAAWTA
ncbi:hypothetical protein B0H17DRAFT_1074527, partial [Mycena rosella]